MSETEFQPNPERSESDQPKEAIDYLLNLINRNPLTDCNKKYMPGRPEAQTRFDASTDDLKEALIRAARYNYFINGFGAEGDIYKGENEDSTWTITLKKP